MLAIQTVGLKRVFPGGMGVHGLDLEVRTGAIYGFLGPNGSGKTTTIRMLLGLLRPQAGTVHLFGQPLTRRKQDALGTVGALVESPSLYPHLSGRENLEVTRRMLGVSGMRVDEVLQRVELAADAERLVKTYSLGMRQRLGIALALLNRPRLLILDEPTNGLDPAGIASMRAFIQCMARESGVTVFLSSHLLAEIEQLASHVGVINAGRLLLQGPLASLRETLDAPLEITCADSASACADLRSLGESPQIVDATTLRIASPQHPDHVINRLLVEHGHAVGRLMRRKRSLESLFLELTDTPAVAA